MNENTADGNKMAYVPTYVVCDISILSAVPILCAQYTNTIVPHYTGCSNELDVATFPEYIYFPIFLFSFPYSWLKEIKLTFLDYYKENILIKNTLYECSSSGLQS